MAKEIQLSRGKVAIVDDEVYESLARHKWHCDSIGYAARKVWKGFKCETVRMHRALVDAPDGMVVDHINGNKLDNRRSNLRVCTRAQNLMNRGKQRNNTSGFKGVSYHKQCSKWMAFIKLNKRFINLGLFDTPEAAALAYNEAAKKYHGEFAKLNEVH